MKEITITLTVDEARALQVAAALCPSPQESGRQKLRDAVKELTKEGPHLTGKPTPVYADAEAEVALRKLFLRMKNDG